MVLILIVNSHEEQWVPVLLFYRNKCLIHPLACIGLHADSGIDATAYNLISVFKLFFATVIA